MLYIVIHYAIYNEILLTLVLSWISMDSSIIEQNTISWYCAVGVVIVNAIVIVNFSIFYGGQSFYADYHCLRVVNNMLYRHNRIY